MIPGTECGLGGGEAKNKEQSTVRSASSKPDLALRNTKNRVQLVLELSVRRTHRTDAFIVHEAADAFQFFIHLKKRSRFSIDRPGFHSHF